MVELAVVLAIISVIVAVGMNMGGDAITFSNRIATQQQMKTIKIAIENYQVRNGVLPCPAHRDLVPGVDASFGEADCATSATPTTSSIVRVGTGASEMRLGMLPVRALNLPDFFATDAWGGKITYAVTQDLTVLYDNTVFANLDIRAGNPSGDNWQLTRDANGGAWIAISHGENSAGAFGYRDTTILRGCVGGTIEARNCDFNDRVFYDTYFNDGEGSAFYFDDFVVWGAK